MRSQQKGFTLIELVVVIVILGLLSAFALPRFLDLQDEARAAAVEGIGGTIKTASKLVRARCQIDSACDDTSGSVELDDGSTISLAGGFAAPTADGILRAADAEDVPVDAPNSNSRLNATKFDADTLVIFPGDSRVPSDPCEVVYRTSGNPRVEVRTSGCST